MPVAVTAALKEDGKTLEERLQPTLRAAKRETVNVEKTLSTLVWGIVIAAVVNLVFNLGLVAIMVSMLSTGRPVVPHHVGLVTSSVSAFAFALLAYRFYQVLRFRVDLETLHALKTFILDVETFIRDHGARVVAEPEMETAVGGFESRFREIMGTTLTFRAVLGGETEAGNRWAGWKVDARVADGKLKGVSEKSLV